MQSKITLGLDPNLDLLPDAFKKKAGNSIQNQLEYFCQEVLLGAKGLLNSVKFQAAYFEKHGLVGLTVLSKMIYFAKNNGFKVILDAKRGDIDRTSQAYANAYLKPGSDFEADFLTVSPFLGTREALEPFVETAINYQKGLFVLVKTSNPGAEEIQSFQNSKKVNLSEYLATEIEKIIKKL